MKKALIGAAVGIVLVVVAIIAIWLFVDPSLEGLRDIMVVVVGFTMFLLFLSLSMVALALIGLIGLLREKLPPLLDTANSTAESVRGTTGFVTERVASPFIKASAAAAGARAAVQTIVRRDNGDRR
ncbi:MAG: hypothetical protein M3506_05030 [Chloroflexota bacterium]|nr:hypothetical protein [Chloroflexota bacterium]